MISLREYSQGRTSQGHQARPSWCYGTPGQARAQQLAGLALGDQERMRVAERALAGCVLDQQVTGLLTDASLCHGWAGVVQALWRAASDALNPQLLQTALREADGAWKTTSPARARQPQAGSSKEHPVSSSPRTNCPARAANCPAGTPACC